VRERAPLRHASTITIIVAGLIAGDALTARTAHPQPGASPRDSARVERPEPVSPGSPRVAVEQFLSLARAGQYAEAAAYLDLADSLRVEHGAGMARRLKAVLDRHLWIDLERISPLTIGDTTDGLPETMDQIGTVQGPDGVPVPIRMVRATPGSAVSWRFARTTVDRIPLLYAALADRWIIEHLPDALLRPGPLELLWWQWLALPLLLGVAALIGAVASRLLLAGVTHAVARTRNEWDDAILSRLGGPLTAVLTLVALSALLPWLALYRPAAEASYRVVRVGFFLVFFWSLWRLVDVIRQVLSHTRWARASASSRALLPLSARVAKVMVVAIAVVAVLSLLGYPVASLIAGLGIGGLAVALAAQKTVENLFGAFSIGVDQPFREGDFVKIEDFVGTVEAVGLRSSRFRTLDRTIVTIPNGRLAEMRLESFTARDRLRLSTVIGLEYRTTPAQMREVLSGFERMLREHPKIWPDAVVVRFREFAASSLDIEIMAWFQTGDWGEFQLIRQEILLQFMDVVERAGTSFAFPTQTVHIASTPRRMDDARDERSSETIVRDGSGSPRGNDAAT
jgi:MscS family membrane protein